MKRTKVTHTGNDGKPTFLKPKRDKTISEFRIWFEGQFGKRPSDKHVSELKKDVETARYDLFKAESMLADVERYENWDKAAHYAWFGLMAIQKDRKREPYPDCPECKTNEDVIKYGTVERRGKKVQNWHCKNCKKTW